MKNTKLISILLFVLISSFFFINKVEAYMKVVSDPAVNTFTIKVDLNYEVTYKYSYIDENNVKHQLKANEVITYENGYTITLADELDSTVDYDTVSYVINNSSYNNSTYTVNGDATIEIVYTLNRYTITYNLNGGTLPEGYPTQYTSMTETFDLPTPTKANNTFLGWGEDVSVSGSSGAISIATEMENGTIYDTGTQNNTHIYLRTLSGEGYAMNVNYNNQDRVMVFTNDINSVVQFSTNRTNWTTIENWETSSDGLYYQFFTLGNGGFNPTPSIVDPGITFNEFTTLVGGGSITIHHVENPYTVTKGSKKDIEVTAQWRANQTYSITFNANRGTGTMNNQVFNSGEPQAISKNTFTRRNYRFTGWNTRSNGRGTSYSDEEVITLNENITLYAQWEWDW